MRAALAGLAAIRWQIRALWLLADMSGAKRHVRFVPESGHSGNNQAQQ
jgi:hypothetical protein